MMQKRLISLDPQQRIRRIRLALRPVQTAPDELIDFLLSDGGGFSRYLADAKLLADLTPRIKAAKVRREYIKQRDLPGFDIAEFIEKYFIHAKDAAASPAQVNQSERDYIKSMWTALTRSAPTDRGSLFTLPYPYIVPGGRFTECFYWDSYFIMLGLESDEQYDMSDNIMRNLDFMASKFGFIPTGNRTYFLTRSQPPLYPLMIQLLEMRHSKRYITKKLPYLLAEYGTMTTNTAWWYAPFAKRKFQRTIKMPNGQKLSRYDDSKNSPRPEAYEIDKDTASESNNSHIYKDLRAAAESGWDFSSRWFRGKTLTSIDTRSIIPIDLNCLLYQEELTIARTYRQLRQPLLAQRYEQKAQKRRLTIQNYLWDSDSGWFGDYDNKKQKPRKPTLAGMVAMANMVASPEQAEIMVETLKSKFLKPGGLITTLEYTNEQWDAPNAWAPLQWFSVVGLRNYGYDKLADEVVKAFMTNCQKTYKNLGKFVEKYDAENPGQRGKGGEYSPQDGFGWSNGVYAAFDEGLDKKIAEINKASFSLNC